MEYQVVLYMFNEPEKKLIIAKRGNIREARTIMRMAAGKGWTMDRRPDVHTYGELVLTIQRAG